MSYIKNIKWEIVPLNLPVVRKHCHKCGKDATFVNSLKFRVNANKKNIDIWLIYQCEKCKSTWNMSIYERINPLDIDRVEYEKFLNNNMELAKEIGFDKEIHSRNKVRLDFKNIEYEILGEKIKLDQLDSKINEYVVEIRCKFLLNIRVDKILGKKLGISRKTVEKLYGNAIICGLNDKNLLREKVGNSIVFRINSKQRG